VTSGTSVTADARPLRITYLFQQFPLPTETFAISDITALLTQGHAVTIFTLKPPRRNEVEISEQSRVPEDLPISRISWSGAAKWPTLLWRSRSDVALLLGYIVRGALAHPVAAVQALLCLPRIIEIAAEVEQAGCDVVHAFWSRHVGLVLTVLDARRVPLLRSAFVGAYDLVADDFLVDATLAAADVVFSHAEVNRPYLELKSPASADIEIVRRGIPLLPLRDDLVRQPFRWITASSLIPAKNVEAVLRAFAFARQREGRLTLDIFGEGPDRGRLESIALKLGCSNAVTFAGHVRREELFAEMQQASAFLLLSTGAWERLPNVLKEALWAGCAVVSSNTPGIEELIPDRTIGHVVDPDNAKAIRAAVVELLECTADERAIGRRAARAHIAEHFSSESRMQCYAACWRSHLSMV
jgi:glycosyltransferase involved in cell wall biosynthesis